jgi:hypothetical protein
MERSVEIFSERSLIVASRGKERVRGLPWWVRVSWIVSSGDAGVGVASGSMLKFLCNLL